MKKLFLFIAAISLTLTASAQNTEKQMATLQHGDQTSVFYGPDALVSAYNAAADSADVITLSSGEFNVPYYISKSLSVYGAGMEDDETTETKRTYLQGDITLKPADCINDDGETVKAGKRVNNIHLEGLSIRYINVENNNNEPIRNLEITKCRFKSFFIVSNVSCYGCSFRQCVIEQGIAGGGNNAFNLLISNCHLQYVTSFAETSTITVDHSLITKYMNGHVDCNGSYNYTNSIMCGAAVSIPSTATVSNCLFAESASYTGIMAQNNWNGLKNAGVWAAEGEDGTYAENKDFALKYPNKYIGTDGTQVGLHGGVYAWNKIPAIPRITECTIDTQDAANGTIKLNIKAEAQTKE